MNKMNKYRELESLEYPVEVYISEDIELDKYKNKNYYIECLEGVVVYKQIVTDLNTGREEEIEDDYDIHATYPDYFCEYGVEEFEERLHELEELVLFDVEYTENPKEEYICADEIKIYIDKIEVIQND